MIKPKLLFSFSSPSPAPDSFLKRIEQNYISFYINAPRYISKNLFEFLTSTSINPSYSTEEIEKSEFVHYFHFQKNYSIALINSLNVLTPYDNFKRFIKSCISLSKLFKKDSSTDLDVLSQFKISNSQTFLKSRLISFYFFCIFYLKILFFFFF
jgi:hypothetical protein